MSVLVLLFYNVLSCCIVLPFVLQIPLETWPTQTNAKYLYSMHHTNILYHSTKNSVSYHVGNATLVHINHVPSAPVVYDAPVSGKSARFIAAGLGMLQNV
jgi:hypothetical protein